MLAVSLELDHPLYKPLFFLVSREDRSAKQDGEDDCSRYDEGVVSGHGRLKHLDGSIETLKPPAPPHGRQASGLHIIRFRFSPSPEGGRFVVSLKLKGVNQQLLTLIYQ